MIEFIAVILKTIKFLEILFIGSVWRNSESKHYKKIELLSYTLG